MKVISVTNQYHCNCRVPKTEVGTEYNATKVEECGNKIFYTLAEFPPTIIGNEIIHYQYDARGFATLPDTTEEVGIEAEQEALIYQR